MVTTLGELYLRSREALLETEEPQMAGQMARDLVSTLSGRTQEQFLVDRDREAPEELVLQVLDGVDRLKRGEPLPYVLGEWTFYGLPMVVSPVVLIPRPSTEGCFWKRTPDFWTCAAAPAASAWPLPAG